MSEFQFKALTLPFRTHYSPIGSDFLVFSPIETPKRPNRLEITVSCFYFRPFTSLIIWTEKVTDNSASLFFHIRITCLYGQYIINPNIVQWSALCAWRCFSACAPKYCCSLRSQWNNLLCKLWKLTLRIKWNETKPHRRSAFTRRRRISHLRSKYFTSKIFHSFRRNKFHWKKHAISVLFSGAARQSKSEPFLSLIASCNSVKVMVFVPSL